MISKATWIEKLAWDAGSFNRNTQYQRGFRQVDRNGSHPNMLLKRDSVDTKQERVNNGNDKGKVGNTVERVCRY